MVHDFAVGLHEALRVERGLSVQHLEHADAERPPVALRAVPTLPVLHSLQSINQSINQTTMQSINQSINLSIIQSINNFINQ